MNFFIPLEASGSGTGGYTMLILIGGMFVLMYFMMIRPQRKQQKAEQEMRNSIEIGDEITTIGGIMGRVVSVKDDTLIIETGADRNKMKMAKWCVQKNNTAMEQKEKELEAAKAAKAAEKGEKKPRKSKKED